jgi:hypothetical protein
MKLGVTRKVKMGASIAAALTIGTIGIFSSTPIQAAETRQPSGATDQAKDCSWSAIATSSYVKGTAGSCYQVQVAAKCNYNTTWTYGEKARSSDVYCTNSVAAVRHRHTSASGWTPWIHF